MTSDASPPRYRDVAAFDERAAGYDQGWLGRLHHDIADRTAEIALTATSAPERVLDVGCGSGYLLRLLAGRCPGTAGLAGIDAAPGMIKVAAASAGRLASGVRSHHQRRRGGGLTARLDHGRAGPRIRLWLDGTGTRTEHHARDPYVSPGPARRPGRDARHGRPGRPAAAVRGLVPRRRRHGQDLAQYLAAEDQEPAREPGREPAPARSGRSVPLPGDPRRRRDHARRRLFVRGPVRREIPGQPARS